ncbi:50S ribosomal protein L35 [soil metagenome]|jgi:large subunit ribosomal protein L35
MPKLKTHSGTKDRVKVTKTGKVLRGKAGMNHLLSKKSKSRKRRLNISSSVGNSKVAKNLKLKLGSK